MRIALAMSCVSAFAFLAAPAFSADKYFEFSEVSGKVLVTTKDGALPAALGQKLSEGASVFVDGNAFARIASADGGCGITLPPKKVTVINYKKLCDVQITPTAIDETPGGVPPPVVGLAFFTLASTVVAISIITNDKEGPVSTP